MVQLTRRSTRKPVTVPEGWTAHDGSGMPVHPLSKPAVLFRIGTRTKQGFKDAAHWRSWDWAPDSREPMDIIAYREEADEWVAVADGGVAG